MDESAVAGGVIGVSFDPSSPSDIDVKLVMIGMSSGNFPVNKEEDKVSHKENENVNKIVILLVLKDALVMAVFEMPAVTVFATLEVGDRADKLMSRGLS